MSNIDSSQPDSLATPVTVADLNAQMVTLRARQDAQTQLLSEMIDAIKELPDADAWSLQRVRIADFNIPFWHLVGFIVKVAIASIPAAIVIAIIYAIVISTFSGAILSAILRAGR